jgi:hypothetical protein
MQGAGAPAPKAMARLPRLHHCETPCHDTVSVRYPIPDMVYLGRWDPCSNNLVGQLKSACCTTSWPVAYRAGLLLIIRKNTLACPIGQRVTWLGNGSAYSTTSPG